jgi:uncharacterized protein with GYD domain
MIVLANWSDSVVLKDGPGAPKSGPLNMITAQTVQDFPSFRSGGLNLRESREGPECNLVREYVASHLPPPARGQTLTVFLEPEIESGYPDIVAVYTHRATMRRWASARACLTKVDVRVAHFLATMGASDFIRLRRFFPANPKDSLERLLDAGVVRNVSGAWRLRALQDVFAVRRLVAIEAKVEDWQDGLQQAFQNIWFASESYLLLPRLPQALVLLDQASRFGVGLRVQGQPLDSSELCPRLGQIPRSYASWLFNEWVWRAGCAE